MPITPPQRGQEGAPVEPAPLLPWSAPMQLADHFRELVDAFSDLIAKHLKLARVELKEDARAIGVEVAKIIAFVPLLITGYVMLAAAMALFLHRYVAADVAFLIVAFFNLVIGAIGVFRSVRKVQGRQMMNDSQEEIEATAIVLKPE